MSILETGISIPLFNADNFASAGLIKELMMSKVANFQGTGDVTYSQCDDDAGVFTFDADNSNNVPAPVVKGSDVTLNLAGIVSDTIEVTNVHIHVDWNGSTLYDEDTLKTTPMTLHTTTPSNGPSHPTLHQVPTPSKSLEPETLPPDQANSCASPQTSPSEQSEDRNPMNLYTLGSETSAA